MNTNIDLQAYGQWRNHLVRMIRQMRFRAAMQLNANNLAHYFSLGQEIIRKQKEMGWGKGVISMLSADLMREFGKGCGYSERNLGYMKAFAEEYPDFPFLQVPLAKIQKSPIWQESLAKLPSGSATTPELTNSNGQDFVQVPLAH